MKKKKKKEDVEHEEKEVMLGVGGGGERRGTMLSTEKILWHFLGSQLKKHSNGNSSKSYTYRLQSFYSSHHHLCTNYNRRRERKKKQSKQTETGFHVCQYNYYSDNWYWPFSNRHCGKSDLSYNGAPSKGTVNVLFYVCSQSQQGDITRQQQQ